MNRAAGQQPYTGPAECIRAARAGVAEIVRQLGASTVEGVERCGDLLDEVGQRLQSAAGMLRGMQGPHNAAFRREVEQLHREVKTLARTLVESDRLISGWVRRVAVKNGGYTEKGASAPLVLIKKVSVEG
jgi:hypothetical protein